MEWIDEIEGYNGSFKGCWQPRAYQKLDSGGRRVRSKKKLGGGWRQRLWRIKVSPKLKILQKVSPKRIFARIHQAYVRTMFRFARKLWLGNDMDEIGGISASPGKEYDELLILQLQNLLLERKHRYATVGTTDASPCGEICL
ncbi:hypothetical protein IEQ34_001712 [Dendrobium chrysotoxum]|uniref:Uncharacterized protein n=1 Tax=Dendrobium chrysotoxum TaxID=161865 RepID=A0AAV7HPE9_DENCH|nr:hypothetical protein IEQ34_001712 [Dendrobium chrysotoxum]